LGHSCLGRGWWDVDPESCCFEENAKCNEKTGFCECRPGFSQTQDQDDGCILIRIDKVGANMASTNCNNKLSYFYIVGIVVAFFNKVINL
jgi:hypothetical protein